MVLIAVLLAAQIKLQASYLQASAGSLDQVCPTHNTPAPANRAAH